MFTAISMRVLVRGQGAVMTAAYLALNLLLLVPSRDPYVVGALMVIGVIGACEVDRRVASAAGARTAEGITARLLMFMPVVLLIGRSAMIYDASSTVWGVALMSVAFLSFMRVRRFIPAYESQIEYFSYAAAGFGWYLFSTTLLGAWGTSMSISVPVIMLPMCAVLTVCSLMVKSGGGAERFLAAALLMESAGFELFIADGVASSLYCILIGASTAVGGFSTERRAFFIAGSVCFVLGLLRQLELAIDLYSMSPWISLAVLGIVTVIASSYVERHYAELLGRGRKFLSDVKAWN